MGEVYRARDSVLKRDAYFPKNKYRTMRTAQPAFPPPSALRICLADFGLIQRAVNE